MSSHPFPKPRIAALLMALAASPVLAAETIEAVGGERCGKPPRPYTVEFLAPEDADVEASAKVMVRGSEVSDRTSPALSLDGNSCPNGRCAFHATKGQSYKLTASSPNPKFDQLCVSITRP